MKFGGNNKEEAKLFASKHYTVEYTATSLFDGLTAAPAVDFSVPPTDSDNVYRPAAVGRIGVIQPDVGSNVQGPRFIDWIDVSVPNAAPAGSIIRVSDVRAGGVPAPMESLLDFEGLNTVYRKNTPILLMPGTALVIDGPFGFSSANPGRIRLGISIPNQEATIAMMGALMDQPGYVPPYVGVRELVTGAPDGDLLGVEASYLIVPAGFEGSEVRLPSSREAFYWGQGDGRPAPIRCGRRYMIDNVAGQSYTITRSGADTINGLAADAGMGGGPLVVITNTGNGDWRVIELQASP